MQTKDIEIKGITDGILVEIGPGNWQKREKALLNQIRNNKEFFEGGRLALDVGNHKLDAEHLVALRNALSDENVTLWAVKSSSPITERTAQNLGLSIRIRQSTADKDAEFTTSTIEGEEAVFVHRTLRSGHKVKHPGHVVVLGDVNPGAEIIAGGNIIVWGRLRGTVHAGARGDQDAMVCALELSPTQLRIADKISISPGDEKRFEPEIAQLKEGQVIASTWDTKAR
jgi:septum site-determining protein MinC